MRILHVNAGNLYGGIESMLVTLARYRSEVPALEQRFALCFDGRLASELAEAGASAEALGPVRSSRPWMVLRARAALSGVVARQRIEAVACHGTWSHAVFGPAVRRSGARLVTWAHAPPSRLRLLDLAATRTPPDLVIANSAHTAAAARRMFPLAPTAIIAPPVEAPPPFDRAAAGLAVRAALATPDDDVVIVVACRLEPWKGVHVLVEALARLRELPGWTCWIAGGAQRPAERRYLTDLQARVARAGMNGRVRFLGARSDVRSLLAAADVYCQPNTAPEPFGIAFVEALDAGLPVVTSPMGGALEVLDARSALFAPPRAAEVAERLAVLVEDAPLRRRLGAAGPARARALCDPGTALRLLASALGVPGAQCTLPARPR